MERMSSDWLLVRGILSSLTLTSKQARLPMRLQRPIQNDVPDEYRGDHQDQPPHGFFPFFATNSL